MSPLLTVIAYCQKDASLTEKLLAWINELGPVSSHHCLLVVDSKVDPAARVRITGLAETAFASVEEILFVEQAPPADQLRWPLWRYLANQMFLTAARHVFNNCRLPWLWLEPDCVPMRTGWLDAIAKEYYSQPKRYMGPIILRKGERPAHLPELNLAGVAVYPVSAASIMERYCGPESVWDLSAAAEVVPKASKTRLIQHTYGTSEEQGWSFKIKPEPNDPNYVVAPFSEHNGLFLPRRDAILFHRCKDGSLIDCLRTLIKASSNGWSEPKPVLWESEVVTKRRPGRPRKIPLTFDKIKEPAT